MNKAKKQEKQAKLANQHKYEVFASIMERAVLSVDRADKYVNGSEPVRDCIRLLDDTTEQVRVALGAEPIVFEYKSNND